MIAREYLGVDEISVTIAAGLHESKSAPDRWMYVSGSLGGSTCSTSSTPLISRPRAATSVATSTLNLPPRKPASVLSR